MVQSLLNHSRVHYVLCDDPRFPYRSELEMPVIGLESEFKVFVDDVETVPEELWRTPAAFIDKPLLKRTTKSSQLPTGGAVYFDGGVIELVTPVIEIAPHCTARVVRSLWEQIGFVRDQLDRWEKKNGRRVRLQAFSCHFNISFELAREERTATARFRSSRCCSRTSCPFPSSSPARTVARADWAYARDESGSRSRSTSRPIPD